MAAHTAQPGTVSNKDRLVHHLNLLADAADDIRKFAAMHKAGQPVEAAKAAPPEVIAAACGIVLLVDGITSFAVDPTEMVARMMDVARAKALGLPAFAAPEAAS